MVLTQQELNEAIKECEKLPISFQNCQKLATFYTILDHITGNTSSTNTVIEETIGNHGSSEFLETVKGKNSSEIWSVIDELMTTLQVINPRLYNGTINKIK